MNEKIFKGMARCYNCHKSMVYFKENGRTYKMCCGTYHRCGGCSRNVWKNEEVLELLELHKIKMEEIERIYLGTNGVYRILLKNNRKVSFDGCTLIL